MLKFYVKCVRTNLRLTMENLKEKILKYKFGDSKKQGKSMNYS